MTVYNKVINHGALQTLDVLVLGMVTLFLFEWALRALRSYVASHTGGRLDAALGSEVIHHLVHLPLRTFERMATGQILERTRQLDSIRQFFASQMPLLLVDLAFVGLFVVVLCYLDFRLGALTLGAMPLFWLLSILARRRQATLVEAGFKAAAMLETTAPAPAPRVSAARARKAGAKATATVATRQASPPKAMSDDARDARASELRHARPPKTAPPDDDDGNETDAMSIATFCKRHGISRAFFITSNTRSERPARSRSLAQTDYAGSGRRLEKSTRSGDQAPSPAEADTTTTPGGADTARRSDPGNEQTGGGRIAAVPYVTIFSTGDRR